MLDIQAMTTLLEEGHFLENRDIEFFSDDLVHFDVWVTDVVAPYLKPYQNINLSYFNITILRKHIIILLDVKLSGIDPRSFLRLINNAIQDFGTGYRLMYTYDFIDNQLTFILFPFYKATSLSTYYKGG